MIRLANEITEQMIKNNIIERDKEDIYNYGVEKILFTTTNVITSLIIGVLLDKVIEIILFQILYSQLRKYVGGYHCKQEKNCYIMSSLIILLVAAMSTEIIVNGTQKLVIILTIISFIIIIKYAPIAATTKPLDDIELFYFRKKAIRNMCFEIIIGMGMYFLGFKQYSFIIALAIILSGALVVVQLIYVTIHRAESSK